MHIWSVWRLLCVCDVQDCFYCQVEHRRLGIARDVPLAVQQWDGLIAVNYAARECGIKRFTSIADALKLCPELKLVHVETIDQYGSDQSLAEK